MAMITGSPCDNATAPINITSSAKKCSSTCKYKYKYAISDCVLTNGGDYLGIQATQKGNNVYFNNALYNVQGARVYAPSLHTYNGSHADGEIIIDHVGGGNNLLVCIPIKVGGSASSGGSSFFHAFLPYAPQKKGRTANVNVSNWTFNSIVPPGKYYFYNGTAPYPPCTGAYNIIVFNSDKAVNVSSTDFSHLTAVIKKNTITTKGAPSGGLFVNPTGSIDSADSDDIFIDCQPVRTPGDESSGSEPAKKQPKGFDALFKSPALAVILGIALITLLKKIYGAFLDLL